MISNPKTTQHQVKNLYNQRNPGKIDDVVRDAPMLSISMNPIYYYGEDPISSSPPKNHNFLQFWQDIPEKHPLECQLGYNSYVVIL